MHCPITIPPLGESITHGTLTTWYATDGQWVEAGQTLYQIETDKISLDGVAEKAGYLHRDVLEGAEVQIHQRIGYVETQASGPLPDQATPYLPLASCPDCTASDCTESPPESSLDSPPLPSTPSNATRTRTTRVPLSPLRKALAAKLVQAKNATATATTYQEVNMERVLQVRKAYQATFQAKHQVRLGLLPFFIKAIVRALAAVPELKSQLEGDTLIQHHYYDIGVAIGEGRGLVVPVLRSCDTASLAELERSIQSYTQKAVEGRLALEDLQGGVLTLSNGGVYGGLLSTPLLNPPHSATLGMHAIQERPIALNRTVVIRPMMYLALSYDHRILDGKQAITFLRHIKEDLEDLPESTLQGYLDL